MPPNDPQWGKRPNDGPPDLDEILRKLQQKLSGLFGNRRPSGPSEPSPPSGMPSGAFFGGSIAFIVLQLMMVAAVIGRRKTAAYVGGVALFSITAGLVYGAWVDGVQSAWIALGLAAFAAALVGALAWLNARRPRALHST